MILIDHWTNLILHWTFARQIFKQVISEFLRKREHAKLPNNAFRSKKTQKAIMQFSLTFSFSYAPKFWRKIKNFGDDYDEI